MDIRDFFNYMTNNTATNNTAADNTAADKLSKKRLIQSIINELPLEFLKCDEIENELGDNKPVIEYLTRCLKIQEDKTYKYPTFIKSGITDITKICGIDVVINPLMSNQWHLTIMTKMEYKNDYSENMENIKLYETMYTQHPYFKYRLPHHKHNNNKQYTIEELLVINACMIDTLNNLKWNSYSGGFWTNNSDKSAEDDECAKFITGLITNGDIKSGRIDNECSVCLEKIGYKLNCGHRCCIECQQQWTKRTCPLCRKRIRAFKTEINNEVETGNGDYEDTDDEDEGEL
jgi:hypothetical protein